VYPENNREVVLKLGLGSEQTMETNPSTHPQAVQKTWMIQNRYGYRYAKVCTPPTVSLSNGRRLIGLHERAGRENIYTKGGGGVRLEGPWRLGAVVRRRGAGRLETTRKMTGVRQVLLLHKSKEISVHLKFRQHLPCTVRFPKPATYNGSMADNHIHINGLMTIKHTYFSNPCAMY
jgi:hypothetical protein